jgi:uncharacterized membrane protein
MMISSIDQYLKELKQELSGCDRATIQDALADAEEFLRNALENEREKQPAIAESQALIPIIEEYGKPEEVAAAYKRIEKHISPSPAGQSRQASRNIASCFFGVLADPKAWGSLLYLLFTLVTGIIYFTWAVTGLSLSLGLIVLIIGLPIAGLFLLSVRGIALIEGRLVEALLGIRMPHRPIFSPNNPGIWGRFKTLIKDKYTWFTLVYMILLLPLGIIYFTVFVVLICVSLWLIVRPIFETAMGFPAFFIDVPYYTPIWLIPLAVIGGFILIVLTMHLIKITGKMHGNLTKAMLVRA